MTQQSTDRPARATGSPSPTESIGSLKDNVSQPAVRPATDRVTILICLLLGLAVWLVFGQTLHHDFVNYDDERFIYRNSAVTQGLSLRGMFLAFTGSGADGWYPLTTLSHMLDCDLYGLNAGGHHLTNMLLHGATAILLFLVLRNLTGAQWRCAFVAAVFAIHPLRVESVAWVTERKDVLSGLFFVLTLGAYARYVRQADIGRPKAEGGVWACNFRILACREYWLALLLFALGLLSKPMLVTLPFVLLLLDYWPLNRLEISNPQLQFSTVTRLILEKIPFLLLSVVASVATILAQESAIVSAQDLHLSLWLRIGNALVSYAVYLRQLFYPFGLAVFYPHEGNQLSAWTAGWCGVVLSLITLVIVRWQRKRPYLLVGWLWYLGMLVPVIGLVQVGGQAHADRYTYLPQIGLYLMVAWSAADLCGAWRWQRVGLSAAAAVILASLLVLAHAQTRFWRDSISLWTHTLASTSNNFLAYDSLGISLAGQGKWAEAIPYFERALQLKPDSLLAHTHLGQALGQQRKWNEAIPYFERAVQLKPDSAIAHFNLGYAFEQAEKWNEAIPYFERALQLEPNYAGAHNALGIALGQQGKWKEAIPHFERALQLNPNSIEARNNLAFALGQQGK